MRTFNQSNYVYMKFFSITILCLMMQFVTVKANVCDMVQEPANKELQQMVDSVNTLLMNGPDRTMQFKLSVEMNGKMSLLDKNQSGFRFNLFQLKRTLAGGQEQGIVFIPEVVGSITTNKFIHFNTNDDTVGLIKFTRTPEESVKQIHAILLRIREYIFVRTI